MVDYGYGEEETKNKMELLHKMEDIAYENKIKEEKIEAYDTNYLKELQSDIHHFSQQNTFYRKGDLFVCQTADRAYQRLDDVIKEREKEKTKSKRLNNK